MSTPAAAGGDAAPGASDTAPVVAQQHRLSAELLRAEGHAWRAGRPGTRATGPRARGVGGKRAWEKVVGGEGRPAWMRVAACLGSSATGRRAIPAEFTHALAYARAFSLTVAFQGDRSVTTPRNRSLLRGGGHLLLHLPRRVRSSRCWVGDARWLTPRPCPRCLDVSPDGLYDGIVFDSVVGDAAAHQLGQAVKGHGSTRGTVSTWVPIQHIH